MNEEVFIKDFRNILQMDEGLELTMDMELAELPEWDSIAQMALITYLRKKINKKISIKEIIGLTSVHDVYKLFS